MRVNPGSESEYEKRHSSIWPDLERVLKEHGVHSYTIFMHPPTGQLFAYIEYENQAMWDAVAETPICRRWWKHMREIMPSNPDNSPISEELQEIFHIDQA